MVMYDVPDFQYQVVYNVLSFALASMMATTLFLWMRVSAVKAKYQSAVLNSGLVTFIAACHYIRIFNSWVNAYSYAGRVGQAPVLTSCIGRYAQIFCCICRIYLNSFLLLLMCCQHSTHRSCLPML